MQANLFDPTRRAPDPRNRIPGSGIGLSIAAKLASLMAAELAVTSEPGRGTCITLALPAEPSDHAVASGA
jgi:signal transduction histidine kinase